MPKNKWRKMDKETQAKEKERRRLKSCARSAAFQAQALEKGMQVRNNALENMGFNADRDEHYKTNCGAGRFGTEAPLESIEATVIINPATDIKAYPERSPSPERIPEAPLLASLQVSVADTSKLAADFNAQYFSSVRAARKRRAMALLAQACGK